MLLRGHQRGNGLVGLLHAIDDHTRPAVTNARLKKIQQTEKEKKSSQHGKNEGEFSLERIGLGIHEIQ
ncbi:MAG TPA: hypothetical protein VL087_09450 [Nitrospirota bacterium]|nr:hypothetical protein [Nitrospirota bacterium]